MPDDTLAPAEPASLDAAWARCEAALPDGGDLELGKYHASDGYIARAVLPADYIANYGDTPAAALIALAEVLEARGALAGTPKP